MTSKQLGTVIQRAISDGAFRRQLQSDPTAALRGFDLTSDEVAAIRGGDPTKLSALGVDQRLSKTFALGDALSSVSRSSTVSDLNTSGSSSAIDGGSGVVHNALIDGGRADGQALISDGNADGVAHDAARFGNADGARDGIVGDPTGSRAVHDDAPADTGTYVGTGNADGTRAVHDDAPADTGTYLNASSADGTRAIHNTEPADTGTLAASSGGTDGSSDAFITADEAGRYGVAGHTDGVTAANDYGDADLSQSIIDAGAVDAHGTGDALGASGGEHTQS